MLTVSTLNRALLANALKRFHLLKAIKKLFHLSLARMTII